MRRLIATLLLCSLLGGSSVASTTPHHHHEGVLTMVIENQDLSLTLTLPADVVIGFEHPPRTKTQDNAVSHAKQQLRQPTLFQFKSPAGFFKKQRPLSLSNRVQTLVYTHDTPAHSHHPHHNNHASFTLTITGTFTSNAAIGALQTSLFTLFPGLEGIQVTLLHNQQSHTQYWSSHSAVWQIKK